MEFAMTDKTRELLALCDDVAEKFVARARKYDADAQFPVENYADMRAAGLMGLMVPENHGGMGADFYQYTQAAGRLAQGDGATAVTFNMHNIIIATLAEVDEEALIGGLGKIMADFRSWVFAEALAGKVFAASLTEPGAGFHPKSLTTTYEKVDGGFKINGKKSFVSLSENADYYVVAAVAEETLASGDPRVSWLVVADDDPGVSFQRIWDTLGMRATVSNNMLLEDVFIPKNRLFMRTEGGVVEKLAKEPHMVVGGFTACYFGIMEAIFNFVVDYQEGRKVVGTEVPIIENELVQHRIGEMSVSLEATRELVYSAARQVVADRGSKKTNAAIHRAKFFVGETGPQLASQAIRLCGGSTISKHLPMERYYRDIRCCGLMPAKSDECLWYVGKEALGFDINKASETYW
jgi:alkylation response protein AidB-like acyl-CoA dehydrogenase